MLERLQRIVDVRRDEVRPMFGSCAYFFCVLASYYIIRPIRDEMALAGGVHNIPWLFTGTLIVMLAVNPIFATLVTRLPRKTFIAYTYRFFSVNLVIFFIFFKFASEDQNIWIGRAFYVWTSVFNLFVVSVFWAFMADTFRSGQGKRLFGFIAFGGTLGGIAGSGVTAALVESVGAVHLIPMAVISLEVSLCVMRRLSNAERRRSMLEKEIQEAASGSQIIETSQLPPELQKENREIIGGSVFAGLSKLIQSPYLMGIALYMLLFTVTATFLYLQQAEIIESSFQDRPARTAAFARIDLAVNILTILTQVLLTGRIIKRIGIGLTLAILPGLCIAGFMSLSYNPTLVILVVFQVLRRAGNFALSRPAREVLYTVIDREDKYKAKSFIDTFIYRAGDQIGAWAYGLMLFIGASTSAIALLAVPVSAIWLVSGVWLGKRQRQFAMKQANSQV